MDVISPAQEADFGARCYIGELVEEDEARGWWSGVHGAWGIGMATCCWSVLGHRDLRVRISDVQFTLVISVPKCLVSQVIKVTALNCRSARDKQGTTLAR